MMKWRRGRLLALLPALMGLLAGCAPPLKQHAAVPDVRVQPSLEAFTRRVAFARRQLPRITRSAEAVAARLVAHPKLLINVPYWPQQTFAEEMLNRSGGLALALPTIERTKEATPNDVVLFSMRSWQMADREGLQKRLSLLKEYRKKGWMIVLFASKIGIPSDVEVDVLIDNGATSPGAEQAAVNTLANDLNGWLWCCEFVSAMTRHGKCTGILKSATLKGSEEHNKPLQTHAGRHWMGTCDTPIPKGQLANIYLKQIDRLIAELSGPRIQAQIRRAAELVSRKINAGGKVGVASCSHFLLSEAFQSSKTPWHAFNVVWQTKNGAFEKNMKKGDLLVWFSFIGINTPYEDYATHIRACGAEFITSFLPDKENPQNNAPDAAAHIDQSWTYGDAVVPIPYAPGHMAPISGINQGLLYRMLDDEASARLKK